MYLPPDLFFCRMSYSLSNFGQLAGHLKEKARDNADLLKRVDALSTEKREADEKFVKLRLTWTVTGGLTKPGGQIGSAL